MPTGIRDDRKNFSATDTSQTIKRKTMKTENKPCIQHDGEKCGLLNRACDNGEKKDITQCPCYRAKTKKEKK